MVERTGGGGTRNAVAPIVDSVQVVGRFQNHRTDIDPAEAFRPSACPPDDAVRNGAAMAPRHGAFHGHTL